METKIDQLLDGLHDLQLKASQNQEDLSFIKEWIQGPFQQENIYENVEDLDIPFDGYEIVGHAGSGNSTVYMVKDTNNGEAFAMKYIVLKNNKVTRALARELALMYDIEHENVVRLHSAFIHGQSLCLVMDLAKSDLNVFILEKGFISPKCVRDWLKQMICAVAYLHNRKIIHRDLKSQNILVTLDSNIKVCDFGLARHGFDGDQLSPQVMTLDYRAPEVFLGCNAYTSAVDMWSIGCIFWEMVMLEKLFDFGAAKEEEMIEKIFKKLGTPTETSWHGVTKLPKFPEGIPLYEAEALEIGTKLSQDGLDLFERLLCCNPKNRITAEDALKHPYFLSFQEPAGSEDMTSAVNSNQTQIK